MLSGVAAGFTQVVRLGPNTLSTTVFAGPSYITIDGFDITVPSAGAGVIVTGSTSCVVRNCYVHGTNTGAGIAIVNSQNCLVENNEVANTAANPGTPGSSTYCGGISVYYTGSGNTLTRNKVHDCPNQGIFVGTSGSATTPLERDLHEQLRVGVHGHRHLPGRHRVAADLRQFDHRQQLGVDDDGRAVRNRPDGQLAVDPQPTTIANNVVRHDGTGACYRFEGTAVIVPTIFDYNLYYPGPTAFVGAVAATNYATLAAWQARRRPESRRQGAEHRRRGSVVRRGQRPPHHGCRPRRSTRVSTSPPSRRTSTASPVRSTASSIAELTRRSAPGSTPRFRPPRSRARRRSP